MITFCACSSLKQTNSRTSFELNKTVPTNVDISTEEVDKILSKRVLDSQLKGKDAVEYLASELYLKASDASLRGESEMAIVHFKYLVILKEDDFFVKKKYAAELIRLGKLSEAEKILSSVYAREKKDESAGLVLGGIYSALNENVKAQSIYETILKNNTRNEEACVLLAKSYFMQKKHNEAETILKQCERQIKESGVFSYYIGKFQLEQNRNADAIKSFEHALKIEPSYYQAVMALGMLSEEKEDWKTAAKIYHAFLESNADCYPIISRYVQILFVLEEYKKVIPYAEKLANYDPADLNLKLRLGVLYAEAKRYDEAKSTFKEILVAVPDSDKVLYYLGSLNELTSDFSIAKEYFYKVDKESPLYHDSSVQIAKIYYGLALNGLTSNEDEEQRRKYFQELEKFIDERISINKQLKFDLSLILGNYYEAKEQFSDAIASIIQLKDLKGYEDNHDYYLASLYEKNNEQGKAREIIASILKKNPENANALNFLGYSYLESGESLSDAYNYISKAVSLKPDDGYIRDSLGWYYYKAGDLKRALQETTKAWEFAKNDVTITKHLAIIHQNMRNYEEAKKFFMEALRNCKIEAERTDVLRSMEGLEKIRLPASVLEN